MGLGGSAVDRMLPRADSWGQSRVLLSAATGEGSLHSGRDSEHQVAAH